MTSIRHSIALALAHRHHAIAAGILGLLLAACIPDSTLSIDPFCADQDLVFDQRLVGEWRTNEKPNESAYFQWKFEAARDKAYRLITTEKTGRNGVKHAEFDAHLFELGAEWFLDLVPGDIRFAAEQDESIGMLIVPGHFLIRVLQFEPELTLAFPDDRWLESFLDAHPDALAHRHDGERIILIAATPELQRFVTAHLAAGEMYGEIADAATLRHVPAASPPPAPTPR